MGDNVLGSLMKQDMEGGVITRKCGRCSKQQNTPVYYPLSSFYKDSTRADGLSTTCKTCCSSMAAAQYRKTRTVKEAVKLAADNNMAPVPAGYKRCTDPKCRRVYEATNDYFFKNERNSDGLSTKCRICSTIDRHRYRSLKWIADLIGPDNMPPEQIINEEDEQEKHPGMIRVRMLDNSLRWMSEEEYAHMTGLDELPTPTLTAKERGLASDD